MDPRTPVLVGAGALTQRCDDPTDGVDAVALMIRAARAAGENSGAPALLESVGWIGVPEGTWSYADPGRLVGDAVGASGAHTVLAAVGVLQQELLTRAAAVIASGDADVALVVGGEAKHRDQQAKRAGVDLPDRPQPGAQPDDRWRPTTLGIADLEMERQIVNPVVNYSLIDRALAAARGWTSDEHRTFLAELWAAFARVAVDNPDAWDRSGPRAADIRDPSAGNRMLAFPYTKLLASQWNVDQAAALVLCSVDAARAAGVSEDQWVFPWAATACNHAVPLVQRAALQRSPGAEHAVARLLQLGGIDRSAPGPIDLYSCFPAAVQVYADALGLELAPPFDDPPTVTGGMTFAGGPLNNYVLQAMVTLARRLRADPGAIGLSSSVSTFLTKQGFSLWSAQPPASGFVAEDVTDKVAVLDEPRPIDGARSGQAVIAASTVDRAGFEQRLVAICEFPDGARTIAWSTDADAITALESDEGFRAGDRVSLDGAGILL